MTLLVTSTVYGIRINPQISLQRRFPSQITILLVCSTRPRFRHLARFGLHDRSANMVTMPVLLYNRRLHLRNYACFCATFCSIPARTLPKGTPKIITTRHKDHARQRSHTPSAYLLAWTPGSATLRSLRTRSRNYPRLVSRGAHRSPALRFHFWDRRFRNRTRTVHVTRTEKRIGDIEIHC